MTAKIMYIPLDERPCNLSYPKRLFKKNDCELLTPPAELLGYKKKPANIAGIRRFIEKQAGDCQILVLATEMVAFGGLLPSRMYSVNNTDIATDYQHYLSHLKRKFPHLIILVSNLIMRTPKYSSDDEEPSYYASYGADIFKYGWLHDKLDRTGLSKSEQSSLNEKMKAIPKAVLDDYETRRQLNVGVNLANIKLVEDHIIEYLVIPQDDSAPYGYTAMDQAKVYQQIKQRHLEHRINVYPGADEVGYTLLARAQQIIKKRQLRVFPIFSGEVGKTVIPLYEDRPLIETMRAQIVAAGAQLVSEAGEADLILAVNVPGKQMIEAFNQINQFDLTYDTFRSLRAFVSQMIALQRRGFAIALADSAYANGGDLDLLSLLDQNELLEQLKSYRAWNTDANTIGSTLATAIILFDQPLSVSQDEIASNVVDDVIYQAIVRKMVTEHYLPKLGLNYFDLGVKTDQVISQVKAQLTEQAQKLMPNYWETMQLQLNQLTFPWNRMFEIETSMEVKHHGQ